MSRKKNDSRSSLRQVERTKAEIKQRSAKLLKNAKLDIRQYRKQLSTLKKQGLVSKRIHAGRHQPTRYMLGKIKALKPVAIGHEIAFPRKAISAHRLREYVEKGLAKVVTFGKQEIVTRPKTAAKQRMRIEKGHIVITTDLQKGQEEVIVFPKRLEDMNDLLVWLEENKEDLDYWKNKRTSGPMPQWGFQLSGFNSLVGLPTVNALINYLMKYDGSHPRERGNIFNGDSHNIIKEFVLYRFIGHPGKNKGQPSMEPYYGFKRPSKKYAEMRGREKKVSHEYRLLSQRQRANKRRLNETKAEKEKRLADQRERDRRNKNKRREREMYQRLMEQPKKRR